MSNYKESWEDLSPEVRESIRERLEGFYGTLGPFGGWTVSEVLKLLEIAEN